MMLKDRRQRLKGLSINRMLPNMLTVLALCAGMSSIRFGLLEQWDRAVLAILVAAVLDALDGRIARLLGQTSRFGMELDSLSDFLSFGAAPGIIVYLWSTQQIGGLGWAAGLFVAVCCALRLARFNVMSDTPGPSYAAGFFTGVPAPAGGGLAILPLIASLEFGRDLLGNPYFNAVWVVVVGLLMVSRIPTFSMKKAKIPHGWVLPILLVIGLLTAALISAPWLTLTCLGVVYVAVIPVSVVSYRRVERAAVEAAAARGEAPPGREPIAITAETPVSAPGQPASNPP
jgi:CDP-diacylglycerol--serine O-phosphatidyltransferase